MAAIELPPWVGDTLSGIANDPIAIASADAPVEDRVWLLVRILPIWYRSVFSGNAAAKAGPLLQPQYATAMGRMHTQVIARSHPEDPFDDSSLHEQYLRGLSASALQSALLATGYQRWFLSRVESVEVLESTLRGDVRFTWLEKIREEHLSALSAIHSSIL